MDGLVEFIEGLSFILLMLTRLFWVFMLLCIAISPLAPVVFQVAYWLKYYKYNEDIEKSSRLTALKLTTRKSYLNIAFVFVLLLPLFNRYETNFKQKPKVHLTSLSIAEQENLLREDILEISLTTNSYSWDLFSTGITVTKLGKIDLNDSVPVYEKKIHTYSGVGLISKGWFEIYSLIEGDNLGDPDFVSLVREALTKGYQEFGPLIKNNVRHHGILNESTDNQSSDDIYALPLRDVIILICFILIIILYFFWVFDIFFKEMFLHAILGISADTEIKHQGFIEKNFSAKAEGIKLSAQNIEDDLQEILEPLTRARLIMLILYLVLILTFLFTGVFSTLRAGSFILGLIILLIAIPSLKQYFQKK